MNEIRRIGLPEGAQAAAGGQADPQLRVAGDRYAWQSDLAAGQALGDTVAGRLMPLARSDHRDPVAALGQAVDEAAERHGDAVDFRGEGFGD